MTTQTIKKTANPLIAMFRQAGNGPAQDHVQTAHERLEDWRMRMKRATGIEPSRKPYKVAWCQTCGEPVWITDPKHQHMTARCAKH